MMYGSFVKFLKSRLIGGCLATILLHLSIDGALCVGLVTEVSGNFVSTRRQSCMIWIAGCGWAGARLSRCIADTLPSRGLLSPGASEHFTGLVSTTVQDRPRQEWHGTKPESRAQASEMKGTRRKRGGNGRGAGARSIARASAVEKTKTVV
jgi:hypothetical protein